MAPPHEPYARSSPASGESFPQALTAEARAPGDDLGTQTDQNAPPTRTASSRYRQATAPRRRAAERVAFAERPDVLRAVSDGCDVPVPVVGPINVVETDQVIAVNARGRNTRRRPVERNDRQITVRIDDVGGGGRVDDPRVWKRATTRAQGKPADFRAKESNAPVTSTSRRRRTKVEDRTAPTGPNENNWRLPAKIQLLAAGTGLGRCSSLVVVCRLFRPAQERTLQFPP